MILIDADVSKAILEMKMPESCYHCNLMKQADEKYKIPYDYICNAFYQNPYTSGYPNGEMFPSVKQYNGISGRAPFCPLKQASIIAPVKNGKWIDTVNGIDVKRCSVCNERFYLKDMNIANFCPNCGADMRAESLNLANG